MSYSGTGLRKISEDVLLIRSPNTSKSFPNISGEISEHLPREFRALPKRLQSISGKVFLYFRKGFRILPETFPNTNGKVSEYLRDSS